MDSGAVRQCRKETGVGNVGAMERVGRVRGGSVGSLKDMWKRKREEEEEQILFRKSKITPRSPGKTERREREEKGLEDERKGKKDLERTIKGMMRLCMEEWKAEMRMMREDLSEGIEKIGREIREREEKWRREREEGKSLEPGRVDTSLGERKGREGGEKGDEGETDRRLREMEKRLERKEREERRDNIMIRGLAVREGRRREAVEGILKEIGVELQTRKIWKIREEREKGREVIGVKVGDREIKKKIWEGKKGLKGKKELLRTGRGNREGCRGS